MSFVSRQDGPGRVRFPSKSPLYPIGIAPDAQMRARRSRKALLTTENELNDMAAAAIIGDSRMPKAG
ncbi:protein of unknown function [Paraburkholderia kururiensis]